MLLVSLFVVGYLLVALEHNLRIDKSATALLMAVILWSALALSAGETGAALAVELRHHLGAISEILFFLLGAMVIVELVDAHDGFRIITDLIRTRRAVWLLWLVSVITFFLSAILDNLTTTIVMLSLMRKLVRDMQQRWLFAGMIVIAANAGGAWSPIGDITTTMLWVGGQVSAVSIIRHLFVPSLVCLLLPLCVLGFRLRSANTLPVANSDVPAEHSGEHTSPFERTVVLVLGLGSLAGVPVFKSVTHLPPWMGVLCGLGVLWLVTDILHHSKNEEIRHPLSVAGVLRRIDITSILFFLGILLAVSALATAGHLLQLAQWLQLNIGSVTWINLATGLLSAVVDNVPLVASATNMYPLVMPQQLAAASPDQQAWLGHFVMDGDFWTLLAYCAGTGGSCLVIGSAAGVAAMGMERIPFFWYLKQIGWLALLGYLAGVLAWLS